MVDTIPERDLAERTEQGTETRHELVEQMGRDLDAWRRKIDELLVQVDLASLDVRDRARGRLELTENVYLAARLRLSDLRHDAGSNVESIRRGLEQLLTDLRQAFEDADAVVQRGRDR